MSKIPRINVVLVSSAKYNLGYFTDIIFYSRTTKNLYENKSSVYSYRGKIIEIDRKLYEKHNILTEHKSQNILLSIFKTSKIIEIPIMIIESPRITFTNDQFRNHTIQKMMEANILVMFYEKTCEGFHGLHDLIGIYSSYLKKYESKKIDEDMNNNIKKVQPCLLIELMNPDYYYMNTCDNDINISDQIMNFQNLIINDSNFYHISIEVSSASIPPDIYRVIESMILDIV